TERLAAGVDIGGTGLKVGLVRPSNAERVGALRILSGHATDDPIRVLGAVADTIRELLAAEGLGETGLAAIGVGSAGLVDAKAGIVRTSPNLPSWRDIRVRDELSARLDPRLAPRVTLINDAAAFLAAEWLAGAAEGYGDVLFVTLGTGVGGGLIMGGRPWRGPTGLGGEIGHMSIDMDGPECPCGNRGCLERFVARGAIERLAVELGLAAEGADNPKRVHERALAGDARASRLFAEIGRRLGAGLAGLANLLEPRLIVVGGGIAEAHDFILPAARAEMELRSMVARQRPLPVVPARFGPEAGVVGAALVAGRGDDRFA
ncbi:MAG TPA: ROK family protein, partial [Candidatus Eisenbacteria bacterium]